MGVFKMPIIQSVLRAFFSSLRLIISKNNEIMLNLSSQVILSRET